MKFVCLECEAYMSFSTVEVVKEGSLGVRFSCPTCNKAFSMVTNPGETQMLTSLGVQIGGRSVAAQPLELTRGALKETTATPSASMSEYLDAKAPADAGGLSAAAERAKAGGCPFSSMVAGMGTAPSSRPAATGLTWSAEAEARLANVPSFVQGMVRHGAEAYAKKHGLTTVTPDVMDAARAPAGDMAWTVEAEERLARVPDYLRPMLKKEIERVLREQGVSTVTAKALDQAKGTLLERPS
jgi:hypothetical protein